MRWAGRVVAGASEVSALTRTTDPVDHREGRDASTSRKISHGATYAAITLKRGVTHDTEFERWAGGLVSDGSGRTGEGPPCGSRSDVTIEMSNEAGHLVAAFKLAKCWVSTLRAMPDLDTRGSGVAIESLTLEHEGIERTEPSDPDPS